MSTDDDAHARLFGEHRGALCRAAYGILGQVSDSEDAVQETWLRWRRQDLGAIERPRSYLLTAVTRTALNVVRTRERAREDYIGPWRPEPVSTGEGADPPRSAEVAGGSLAMLVVCESLSPLERAALDDLLAELSPDIVLTADAGGHAAAARRPISGVSKVLRFTAGILAKPETQALSWKVAELNGAPALLGYVGDKVEMVVWFEIAGEVVTRVDMVRNPDKLGYVSA